MRIKALSAAILVAGLSACSSNPLTGPFVEERHLTGPERIVELKGMRTLPADLTEDQESQFMLLRETAYRIGFAEGVYYRYSRIEDLMIENEVFLDQAFPFERFVIDGRLMPPIIHESDRMSELVDDRTVRTIELSYTIGRPARIVSQPPTWRDYLLESIDRPSDPDDMFLPQTEAERSVWRDALDQGWNDGIAEADRAHEQNVNRMERDFYGLQAYESLVLRGVMTEPELASDSRSIVSEDGTLNVDDTVYQIVTDSDFITDANNWRPLFREGLGDLGRIQYREE